MRYFLFAFMIFLVGCGEPKAQIYPDWYAKRQLISHAKYEIIGYGEGSSAAEAQAKAKEEIAQTLQSDVSSIFYAQTTDSEARHQSLLKISSSLRLQDIQTLRQEQRDGRFFAALMYENLDFVTRIKRSFETAPCTTEIERGYLEATPLYKKIAASLGCDVKIDLVRKERAWYVKVTDTLFVLTRQELEELFVSMSEGSSSFRISQERLYDKDLFWFEIGSQNEGYVTLFDVYANGVVTLLSPSKSLTKKMQIPSSRQDDYFEAGLLKEGEDTHDLFVAIFSKEPLGTSRFEYANEELATNEETYKFDELLELMQNYEFATLFVRTKAK